MNPIALLVVAVMSAGGCNVLSAWTSKRIASEDAFNGLSRFLSKLSQSVEFVTVKNGTLRFWPRGTYRGVSYDGRIVTYVVPNSGKRAFTVITSMYVDRSWKEIERTEFAASALLAQLRRNDGTALGIPIALRREMAQSSIHRGVVCGVPLSQSIAGEPE